MSFLRRQESIKTKNRFPMELGRIKKMISVEEALQTILNSTQNLVLKRFLLFNLLGEF